jgi:hypothetical protein
VSWYRDGVGVEFLKVVESKTYQKRASEGGGKWKELRDMYHNVVICNK